jgi:hypothetical protein
VASVPSVTEPAASPAATPVTQPPPPPPTPAGELVGLTTEPQAEAFVRDYYDLVAVGDYPRSWAQLAPEFQHGKARSYEYYVNFWNANDVEIGDVDLVDVDRDRVVVRAALRWNGEGRAVVDELTLRPGDNGELLITRQEAAG